MHNLAYTLELPQPTVLVVDDNVQNLDLIVEYLQHESMQLLVSLSGVDCIKIAKAHLPDLILLDVMMPDLDGFEVCRQLKADPKTVDIPIIFLSARSDDGSMEKGLLLGAIDYLSKPLVLPVFKARLKNHLMTKQRTDQLVHLACTDALTQVANRRHFDKMCKQELLRAKRSSSSMSIMMIDIDYFKQFNDFYGHQAGDHCLRRVAKEIDLNLFRPGDLVARYGGEEFIVLLPCTDLADATKIASRLLVAIQRLNIQHCHSKCAPHVSISIGVASVNNVTVCSHLDLLHQVDKNLYSAKQHGRNQLKASECYV